MKTTQHVLAAKNNAPELFIFSEERLFCPPVANVGIATPRLRETLHEHLGSVYVPSAARMWVVPYMIAP